MQFEFIADRPVLDFVATLAERGTSDLEKLATPADLADWVSQSGIVDSLAPVAEVGYERARAVREALFRLIAGLIDGNPPGLGDRELVNAAAARPRPTVQLSAKGQLQRVGDLDAVLAALATDCLDLFDSPQRDALSWCADPRCTRPFLDRSRGHRRRWCGMQGCGDRAKAAAYRQRRRSAAPAHLPPPRSGQPFPGDDSAGVRQR